MEGDPSPDIGHDDLARRAGTLGAGFGRVRSGLSEVLPATRAAAAFAGGTPSPGIRAGRAYEAATADWPEAPFCSRYTPRKSCSPSVVITVMSSFKSSNIAPSSWARML